MPPVIVALLHAPLTAVWVIIAYVGIQEIEGHIAAPLIMGTRFRVHPLVVIFALLIGNQLHGIIGMFIAVPLIPLARETWIFFRAACGSKAGRTPCSTSPAGGATTTRRRRSSGRGRPPRPAHPAGSARRRSPTRRDLPTPETPRRVASRRFPS